MSEHEEGEGGLPRVLDPRAARIAGAEPWTHAGGRTGVLVLHGLTGSPWEVMPLANHLARWDRTVAVPLLAGHGTDLQELARTGWQDWLASARQALRWLEPRCEDVHLIGLSLGGLLALLLSAQRMRLRPLSVTLLAPAFALGPWTELALRAIGRMGWPTVLGKADPALPEGRPPAYHAMPVQPLGSLLELQQVIGHSRPRPPCPALMLYGTADATIPWRQSVRVARDLLGDALRTRAVPGAGHLMPRSAQAHDVLALVEAFLRETERRPGQA